MAVYHLKSDEKIAVHFQLSLILKAEHVQLSSFSMTTFSFEKYETLLFEMTP